MDPALQQLLAVFLGGLLATGGSILTTLFVDRRRRSQESRSVALAFRGEIDALVEHIRERGYLNRFQEVIEQIEASGEPFYMPMRVRFRYDRVYEENVSKLGSLPGRLPELIPLFYTRLNSVLEDMTNLGEGQYASLELQVLLRVYRDARRILERTVELGEQIIETVDELYRTAD